MQRIALCVRGDHWHVLLIGSVGAEPFCKPVSPCIVHAAPVSSYTNVFSQAQDPFGRIHPCPPPLANQETRIQESVIRFWLTEWTLVTKYL